VACKAAAIIFVVKHLEPSRRWEKVIGVLRGLDTLSDGKFLESFTVMLPVNGRVSFFTPRFVATPGRMGALDEVLLHFWCVLGIPNVLRYSLSDLGIIVEKSRSSARDPRRE
jgi:hypothetical protein